MPVPLRKTPVQDAPLPPALSLVAQGRVASSLRTIDSKAWDACFPNELEGYDYLLAVEEAGIGGFSWRYVMIEEQGRMIAAMPAFLTDYRLDTTLGEGALRRAVRRVRQRFPRFLTMKLACLGSPATECGLVGFHPDVEASRKPELLVQLLTIFEHYATMEGYRLIGIKDVPEQHKALWEGAAPGYAPLSGMATAHLDINFSSIDEYLSRLSYTSRKDMRRKLKKATAIYIEERTHIDDVLPQVLALYRDTRARSEFQFEELTESYFRGVLAHMPNRALCTLYWRGDTLLAANLMLKDGHKLLDKFFCMDGECGREHNLYFVSWFHNLQYCIDHGIPHYQSGQACYGNKLRLKSRLQPNWMLFKHANPLMNKLLQCIAPLLETGEDHD